MTLNEVMTQTADAIREKTGTTEKIAPVNFAEEIKSISAGGGESSKRYYKIELNETTDVYAQFYGTNIKVDVGDGRVIVVGIGMIFAVGIPSTNWKAVAIDIDTPTFSPMNERIISFREQIEMEGGNVDDLADAGLISITKEEFYTLE